MKEDVLPLSPMANNFEHEEEVRIETISNQSRTSLWSGTTRRQKLILALLAMATFTAYFTVAIPGTFLARIVLERGQLKVFAVIIMQSALFFSGISSLICGVIQTRLGCKRCLVFGLGLAGFCHGAFGFLKYLDNNAAFIVCGTVLKSLQGIGQGIMTVTSLAILFQELPDHMERAFGIIQSSLGFGYLLGPVVGSLLYSIRNEMLIPFLVSAILPVLVTAACYFGLKEISATEESLTYRIRDYICKPSVIFLLGLAAGCSGVFAAYDVTFTTYLQTMGITVINAGWIMLVGDVAFAIGGIFAGYLSSLRILIRRLSLAIGYIGFCGALISYFPSQPKYAIYIATVFFGFCGAIISTTAFMEIMDAAASYDASLKSDLHFQSKISGAWCFLSSMSQFIIPLICSGLQSTLPYHIAQIVTLAITITVGSLTSLVVLGLRKADILIPPKRTRSAN